MLCTKKITKFGPETSEIGRLSKNRVCVGTHKGYTELTVGTPLYVGNGRSLEVESGPTTKGHAEITTTVF